MRLKSIYKIVAIPIEYLSWGLTGPTYRYIGCYGDTAGPFLGRTLPQGLVGRTGVGVEECAAAALGRGFPFFALQGYGQCFFGSMADVARVQASQSNPDAVCNGVPCPASATTCRGYINKVYFITGMHVSLGFCAYIIFLLHIIVLGQHKGHKTAQSVRPSKLAVIKNTSGTSAVLYRSGWIRQERHHNMSVLVLIRCFPGKPIPLMF
jgi:hypothetical protein